MHGLNKFVETTDGGLDSVTMDCIYNKFIEPFHIHCMLRPGHTIVDINFQNDESKQMTLQLSRESWPDVTYFQ